MKTIDNAVLAGYNAGIERDRLRTGIGLIEFERTKEILRSGLFPFAHRKSVTGRTVRGRIRHRYRPWCHGWCMACAESG